MQPGSILNLEQIYNQTFTALFQCLRGARQLVNQFHQTRKLLSKDHLLRGKIYNLVSILDRLGLYDYVSFDASESSREFSSIPHGIRSMLKQRYDFVRYNPHTEKLVIHEFKSSTTNLNKLLLNNYDELSRHLAEIDRLRLSSLLKIEYFLIIGNEEVNDDTVIEECQLRKSIQPKRFHPDVNNYSEYIISSTNKNVNGKTYREIGNEYRTDINVNEYVNWAIANSDLFSKQQEFIFYIKECISKQSETTMLLQ